MSKFLILFGSQTGNAEDVAYFIAREAFRRKQNVEILSCDDYDIMKLIEEKFVLIVASTTGHGEPPDNMKKFWKFIWRKILPSDCLSSLHFSLVGLGDSSYQLYNIISKKLFKRFKMLGGIPILPPCLCDDQHPLGVFGNLDPWLKEMWEGYFSTFQIPHPVPLKHVLPAKYNVKILNEKLEKNKENEKINNFFSKKFYLNCKIISKNHLTPSDHWQNVVMVTIETTPYDVTYQPGDICWVLPSNRDEIVAQFLKQFQLNGETLVELESSGEGLFQQIILPFPKMICLQSLFKYYLDLTSLPKLYFWEIISNLDQDNLYRNNNSCQGNQNGCQGDENESRFVLEQERLKELVKPENLDDLYSYCYRPKRNVMEVLSDFPSSSSRLSLSRLLDIISIIKPRPFSISSSQLISSSKIELLVAEVKYKTTLFLPRVGLCSNYLANLKPNQDKIWLKIEKGSLIFPNSEIPVVMVGPGTGCAPFRSFILQRSSKNISNSCLFFGNRNEKKDFFFKNEFKNLEKKNLLKLFTAFSRDQSNKIYVQNVIKQQKEFLINFLNKGNCFIFIAGNSKQMPDQVKKSFAEVFEGQGEAEGMKIIEEMIKSGRFQVETW